MAADLTNRAAIITGGKRIGAAIAVELARRGMDVALSFNRSRSEAEDVAGEVRALGRRAFVHQADLANSDEAAAFIDRGGRRSRPPRRAAQHGVGLPIRCRSRRPTCTPGTP